MANKRSALKAHRVSERKRLRNRAVRSEVRTYVKKARVGLAAGAAEERARRGARGTDRARRDHDRAVIVWRKGRSTSQAARVLDRW